MCCGEDEGNKLHWLIELLKEAQGPFAGRAWHEGGGTYLYTWNTSLHITHRVLQWMQCQQAKYNCATPAHCTENVMRCDVHVYKGELKVFFFYFGGREARWNVATALQTFTGKPPALKPRMIRTRTLGLAFGRIRPCTLHESCWRLINSNNKAPTTHFFPNYSIE